MTAIQDPADLRAHFGSINPLAERKVMLALDRHARHFIELSPLLVLATADAEGGVDASPRGDPPGFVQVIDDRTLLIPDRPGNNRVDSFTNILERPGIGLIFFVPGIDETLRVNGTARVIAADDALSASTVNGKPPKAGLSVAIAEVFFHCGKALKRAHVWDPARHVERSSFPSLGRILAEQIGGDPDETDRRTEIAYRERLY